MQSPKGRENMVILKSKIAQTGKRRKEGTTWPRAKGPTSSKDYKEVLNRKGKNQNPLWHIALAPGVESDWRKGFGKTMGPGKS